MAVVVAHEPGPWFEETLRSLAAQTYRSLSVLVVATADDPTLADRVAAVLPDAHHRRAPGASGFGAACNDVLGTVEGAAFFLLCHDDVRLDPGVVQVLVEEAFRSNAGVVGPKLVDWHHPDRLLSVGMGADKLGYPSPTVERGELDQAQHDAVRDVLYVPGAATLVRADLFATLGGFDDGIDLHGDDLDLCWRAHVAGARVVVAPAARVAHLEALGRRRPVDDRRRLQARHRQRAVRVASAWGTRLRVVPLAALLTFLEVAYCILVGRFRQARDVAGAWWWNWRRWGQVRRRRRALAGVRTVRDRDLRPLQAKGSARLAAFLRGQIGGRDDRLPVMAGAGRDLAANLRSSKARTTLVAWALILVVLVVGSRDLLFGRLSAVGELVPFGSSAFDLVEAWWGGFRSVGLGAVAPTPTGVGFFGGLGVVSLGALDLLRKVAVLGTLPVGLAGVWRLCRPIGSRRAGIVAVVVYAAVPVPYNALAHGSWSALVVYAAVPWMLSQLTRATGVAPFGPRGGVAGPGVRRRPLVQRALALGVVAALAAMVVPLAVVAVPVLALALVVGGLVAGQAVGALRLAGAAVGGVVVAVALQLPWGLAAATGDWWTVAGSVSGGIDGGAAAVLRFDTGPLGAGPLGYLFLAAAALPLLIGRGWRLSWSVRGWALVLVGMALAWVQAEGWVPDARISPELLLVPAAAGLALATAMGMAAFEVDLRDYHFGLRQLASLAAGAALALAVLPTLGAATGGAWGQPRGDYAHALSFMDHEGEAQPFRVLWLGDVASLPTEGWVVEGAAPGSTGGASGELAYATSTDGTPTLPDRLPGPPQAGTERLGDVLSSAVQGGTSRLGGLVAPMGIRYVVVPLAQAPEPYQAPTDRPDDVRAMLDAQLDLVPVTAAGALVYENGAWGPTRAALPAGAVEGDAGDGFEPAVQGARVALPDQAGAQGFEGRVDAGEVFLSAQSSERWRLEVEGVEADRREVLGWANAFAVDQGGPGRLWFDTPLARHLALVGQVALWVVAVVVLLRVRVVSDERRTLPGPGEAVGEGGS